VRPCISSGRISQTLHKFILVVKSAHNSRPARSTPPVRDKPATGCDSLYLLPVKPPNPPQKKQKVIPASVLQSKGPLDLNSLRLRTISQFYKYPQPPTMLSALQNPRQAAAQLLNFGLILSTAFMMWKGLSVLSDSPSPIVVVLSGSMEPAFFTVSLESKSDEADQGGGDCGV
jgi:hypothetical protein